MSDYIDTVDIEGTQYNIQDTATKNALLDFETNQDYATEEKNTGLKWLNGKDIFKKTFNTRTPLVGNSNFLSTANTQDYPIGASVDEIVKIEGMLYFDIGVYHRLGNIANNTLWSTFWARNNQHASAPNAIVIAVGSEATNKKLLLDVFYTKA